MWSVLKRLWGCDGDESTRDAPPARAAIRPQFERLETRENPAAMADAIVWGNSWQQYFVGSDSQLHVHYSVNGGAVQNLNLSAALNTNATFSKGIAPIAATTFGNNPFVFVRTSTQNMHAFYWTGAAWADADLSTAASDSTNVQPGQIAAHVWNGIPHVFFLGGDQHVHELYWTNAGGWKALDVSAASGTGAKAHVSGVMTALVGGDATERVYYQASDNRVRELKWSGPTGWTDSDVTGAGPSMYSSAAEISAVAVGNGINVYYQAGGHVHQLANYGAGWTSTDVTAAANSGLLVHSISTLQAYYYDGKYNVFYRGGDDHLRGFQWSAASGWKAFDLTAQTGATPLGNGAGNATSIGGNITTLVAGDTQVAFYIDANNKVDRMFNWDPLFGWQNVTGTTTF